MLQQIVKKIPVQTAAAQVSTSLSQGGQRQVLVLDFMEEDQELLETLCTQSVGSKTQLVNTQSVRLHAELNRAMLKIRFWRQVGLLSLSQYTCN